jgi:hypothetical protein
MTPAQAASLTHVIVGVKTPATGKAPTADRGPVADRPETYGIYYGWGDRAARYGVYGCAAGMVFGTSVRTMIDGKTCDLTGRCLAQIAPGRTQEHKSSWCTTPNECKSYGCHSSSEIDEADWVTTNLGKEDATAAGTVYTTAWDGMKKPLPVPWVVPDSAVWSLRGGGGGGKGRGGGKGGGGGGGGRGGKGRGGKGGKGKGKQPRHDGKGGNGGGESKKQRLLTAPKFPRVA